MWPSASFTGNSTIAPSSGEASGTRLDSSVPRPLQAVSPSMVLDRATRILAEAMGNGKPRQTRRNRVMSSAKVFIFAPVEEARDSHKRLEAEGCELRLGKASWDTPQGNGEPELIRMAQGAHALMGTSIRNVPISRTIMESSPELRVVAKYTIGVADVDVEAATAVVSLHVVLTRETRHMIGAEHLALMKRHAILINTSRGPCVQEAALIETLLKGEIGGAALDVFEQEPLALDSQLRNLGDRVLLSPHVVSNNVGSGLGPGIAWATESVLRALRGEVPDNVYNKEVIPRWERRFGGTSVW